MKPQYVDPPARLRAHVYAIIRVDVDPDYNPSWENRITVVRVVVDSQFADAEVSRLNALNKAKGCLYFKQVTRFENPPVEAPSLPSATPDAAPSDQLAAEKM